MPSRVLVGAAIALVVSSAISPRVSNAVVGGSLPAFCPVEAAQDPDAICEVEDVCVDGPGGLLECIFSTSGDPCIECGPAALACSAAIYPGAQDCLSRVYASFCGEIASAEIDELEVQRDSVGLIQPGAVFAIRDPANAVIATVAGPLAKSAGIVELPDPDKPKDPDLAFNVWSLESKLGSPGTNNRIASGRLPGAGKLKLGGSFAELFTEPQDFRNKILTASFSAKPAANPAARTSGSTLPLGGFGLEDINGNTCSLPAVEVPESGALGFEEVTSANCGGAVSVDLTKIVAILLEFSASDSGAQPEMDFAVEELRVSDPLPEPAQPFQLLGVAIGMAVVARIRRERSD